MSWRPVRRSLGEGTSRRAVILLSVAWCILILGLLLASRICREEYAFVRDRSAQTDLSLRLAAQSVEAMFRAGLEADAASKAETNYDAPSEVWGWTRLKRQYGEDLERLFPDVALNVEIEDEGSKINPLKASPATMNLLLVNLGWPEVQSRELAAAIVKSCQEAMQGGAAQNAGKAERSLAGADKPAFLDLRSLLALPGLSAVALYGEDANFSGGLDPNESDGDESWPPDDRDAALRRGLMRFLSIWGDGKMNPNMAPVEALMTVPGMSKKIAAEISDRRLGSDGLSGNDDDFVFKSLKDMKNLSGVSKFAEFEQKKMAPYLRMTTDCYQLRICAASKRNGQILRRQTVIRRKKGKIITISQTEDSGS